MTRIDGAPKSSYLVRGVSDISSESINGAGVLLMHYVSRLEADGRLKGNCASNTPHYYECGKGIYDGIAACLETIAGNSGLPSFRESLQDAAEQLRRTDPAQENPEKLPNVIQALVYLIGALMEIKSEPSPDV